MTVPSSRLAFGRHFLDLATTPSNERKPDATERHAEQRE